MNAWLDDGDVRLYHGDALEQLALMPSESVHCIVTSPPFWGLRDYGTGSWTGGDPDCDHSVALGDGGTGGNIGFRHGSQYTHQAVTGNACKCGATRVDQQIGLEETPDAWCARLVSVMREARRVLRSDGVAFVELGDTFSDKQLTGAPWRFAFAMQEDGWFLRSDIIWARLPPNPMPESVTDRPTKAHSYVFLLTKSARYFMDMDAIREPHQEPERSTGRVERIGSGAALSAGTAGTSAFNGGRGHMPREYNPAGRNARSVWSIPTEPTPFAHFATFPTALVERCIKAGTSERGACSECGAPWRRIVEKGELKPTEGARFDAATFNGKAQKSGGEGGSLGGGRAANFARDGFVPNHQRSSVTTGWEPSCAHDAPVTPCRVLDPFVGSGTTCLVARRLGRHAWGIELNAEYLQIAAKRLEQLSLLA